jgi:hypothetical protein
VTRFRVQVAVLAAAVIGLTPVLLGATATAGAAQGGQAAAGVSHMRAVKVGTFSFANLGAAETGKVQPSAPPHQPMNKTLRHTSAASVPNVAATPVATGTGGAAGFNGLDVYQQTNAGTGIYANSHHRTRVCAWGRARWWRPSTWPYGFTPQLERP